MYRCPVGFSVTRKRPSGRNAIAHGRRKPDAISVIRSGVLVFTSGARVCSGNAGLFSGIFGGPVLTGAA
jgi:hypothetical protein